MQIACKETGFSKDIRNLKDMQGIGPCINNDRAYVSLNKFPMIIP